MIVRTKFPVYTKVGDTQSLILNGRAGQADDKGLIWWFMDQTHQVKIGFDKDICLNSGLFSVARDIQDKEVSLRDVETQLKDMNVSEEVINELKMRL